MDKLWLVCNKFLNGTFISTFLCKAGRRWTARQQISGINKDFLSDESPCFRAVNKMLCTYCQEPVSVKLGSLQSVIYTSLDKNTNECGLFPFLFWRETVCTNKVDGWSCHQPSGFLFRPYRKCEIRVPATVPTEAYVNAVDCIIENNSLHGNHIWSYKDD